MAASELATFEGFCETLYNSPSAEERAKAEAALVQLSTTPEYIPKCQFVLSNSTVPYAQLVAGNALKRLLQSSWNHLTLPQRAEYRNFVSRTPARRRRRTACSSPCVPLLLRATAGPGRLARWRARATRALRTPRAAHECAPSARPRSARARTPPRA